MSIRIVRLGSERQPQEGLRIGTVRRPPRGVPRQDYSTRNFFDVWYPNLAPSEVLLKSVKTPLSDREWKAFARKYRAEMSTPEHKITLDLLAVMSHRTNFSVGCYCADESRCHRSILRDLLCERGAKIEE